MNKISLILAGGFLGSGKTTAIAGAGKKLKSTGVNVGIITNDQGTEQVDGRYLRGEGMTTEEVSGGCFCCNFTRLEEKINQLGNIAMPEIIFAESVGSCVDLAATVVNPLLSFHPRGYDIVLTVFADIRLLTLFLLGDRGVFYDSVNYIYGKQLEEADIIVANKTDLLSMEELSMSRSIITGSLPGKKILFQDSRSDDDVERWLNACRDVQTGTLRTVLELDYKLYGEGEAELAWLDEEIGIVSTGKAAVDAAGTLINLIHTALLTRKLPIGHLKFLIDNGSEQVKLGFYSGNEADNCYSSLLSESERVVVLINARVQTEPETLQGVIEGAILETEKSAGCRIIEKTLSAFSPGQPVPTFRIDPGD